MRRGETTRGSATRARARGAACQSVDRKGACDAESAENEQRADVRTDAIERPRHARRERSNERGDGDERGERAERSAEREVPLNRLDRSEGHGAKGCEYRCVREDLPQAVATARRFVRYARRANPGHDRANHDATREDGEGESERDEEVGCMSGSGHMRTAEAGDVREDGHEDRERGGRPEPSEQHNR